MAFYTNIGDITPRQHLHSHYNIAMSLPRLFRYASVIVVISIWILSFLPGVAMPTAPGNDKWHHALAYFACMFVWGQWVTLPVPRLKLAIIFIVMGALIECLQGMTTYRSFEWLDMVADTVGVVLAWIVVTVQLSVQRRFSRDANADGKGRGPHRSHRPPG